VLDLVGALLVEVLADPVGSAALGLGEGGEPGEQVVDLPAVVRAEGEGRDVGEIAQVRGGAARPPDAVRCQERDGAGTPWSR